MKFQQNRRHLCWLKKVGRVAVRDALFRFVLKRNPFVYHRNLLSLYEMLMDCYRMNFMESNKNITFNICIIHATFIALLKSMFLTFVLDKFFITVGMILSYTNYKKEKLETMVCL